MKDIIIRNENASHRFIRNYMAARAIADLNTLKHEGVDINHGSHRPVNLLGDKPSQPASDRLTYQPFATLSV
jgi:hypothetical protein